jgi:basic membrane protein A and related proteins
MPGRRPSLLTALSVGALSVTVLAGCNASSSGGGGGSAASGEGGPSLILITPEPVGVNPFLQLAVDGVNKAADDAGGKARVFESQDPTNIQQQMDAAVADKPDVLAVVGFEFADAVAAAAAANPDQKFLFVDACTTETFDNVTCAVFREHEGVYLAGVEAGLLSQTKKIGVVAALDTPFIRRWVDPFQAGAVSVDPAVTSTPLFVGGDNPFGDPARGKAQGQVLADQGADQVLLAASGSNVGAFEVATAGGFQAYGVDVNECASAPGHVVDNVLKHVDVALAAAVKEILDGKTGGSKVYGLKEKGVGLTALEDDVKASGCLIADHPDVIEKVKQVQQQIIDGTVTVDDPAAG